MSIFGSPFGKKEAPPNPIRETLFGDMPLDAWPNGGDATDEPWGGFVSARLHLQAGNQSDAVAWWRHVLEQPGLESRQYLQAWHFLRQHGGEQPPPDVAKQVLGVVVEVGMPQGLDLLAAYPDHSARYYNYSGAGVVWEHPDTSLDTHIDQLLAAARQVVPKIGPWEQARPAPPPEGQARTSFLTPIGLHFGQGPMDALSRDPLGGRVLQLATILMRALIAKTNAA